jgi:hypothetical protein
VEPQHFFVLVDEAQLNCLVVWNIRKVGLLTYQNGCFMGFNGWLVVWNMAFIFPYLENVIIPTDFHIFQRGSNHQPENNDMFSL